MIAGLPVLANQTADFVLGQFDLVHNGPNIVGAVNSGGTIKTAGVSGPNGIAISGGGAVYVADTANSRVLVFSSAAALTNGQAASMVIGQPDGSSSQCNRGLAAPGSQTLCSPKAVAVQAGAVGTNVFVADTGNNRVLVYVGVLLTGCTATTPCVGPAANLLIGQSSFSSAVCAAGQAGLCGPSGVGVDASGNVYVGDTTNNRVMEFDSSVAGPPCSGGPGCNANIVFGQPTAVAGPVFTAAPANFSQTTCFNDQNPLSTTAVNRLGLCGPTGVALDGDNDLFVADTRNNRVLEYNSPLVPLIPNVTPSVVFGQPVVTAGPVFTAGPFNFTQNTCFNGATAATAVSDLGLCGPGGVVPNTTSALYVADTENSRILRYLNAPPNVTADEVLGQGDSPASFTTNSCNGGNDPGDFNGLGVDSLCQPGGLALDASNNPWVADTQNNRLLQFSVNSDSFRGNADLVLGQADFTHNPVNDLAFTEVASNSSALNGPVAVAIDGAGHVYVADPDNNRVLGWPDVAALTTNSPATLVIGQPDMASGACNQGVSNPSGSTLCAPFGVAVDSAGNLYVGDANNSRVLEYNTPFSGCAAPPATCIGGPANQVFGQKGLFTTLGCNNGVAGLGSDSLCGPGAVAVDGSNNLYVADTFNSRVLEYNAPLVPGGTSSSCHTPPCSATAVFGQVNVTSQVCADGSGGHAVSATGMCQPNGVGLDSLNDLFVADTSNNRVLEFNAPTFTLCTQSAPCQPGPAANRVFGQGADGNVATHPAVATTNACATSATGLCAPTGLALDAATALYISDSANNRVLEFNGPLSPPPGNQTANIVFGQPVGGVESPFNFTGKTCFSAEPGGPPSAPNPVSALGLCGPGGLAVVSPGGDLLVTDTTNNRVPHYHQPLVAPTHTPTPTATPTATGTATPTSTATVTATETPTGTATATGTATQTPTGTATATETATETATVTATATGTATETATITATATGTATEKATETATATGTATEKATETATASATATGTATGTATQTPTATATSAATATETAIATATATEKATETATASATATATPTATATSPATATATETPAPTSTSTEAATATPTVAPTATATALPTMVSTATGTPTSTETPAETATETPTPTPTCVHATAVATATPIPGAPVITEVSNPVVVGESFTLTGENFHPDAKVNFFLSTASGPLNAGPLTPSAITPTSMTVPVPDTIPLQQGTVAIVVVNPPATVSNVVSAALTGDAALDIPTITSIDGIDVARDSTDLGIHQDNVEKLIQQGEVVTIGGTGFDNVNGVVVDMFCNGCPGGKVAIPAVATLTSVMVTVPLPDAAKGIPLITGNVSFDVTNAGADHLFKFKSNAVAVPILALPAVTTVVQSGDTITVTGDGFIPGSVLNFFNLQNCGGVVNLGGADAAGHSKIPLNITSLTSMSFTLPPGVQKAPSYVQIVNPPFVPFTSSGTGPGGSFTVH